MSKHIELGRSGEDYATDYLERKGFEVIERNWRCRWGEIDLVARNEHDIVCVEVKTRRSLVAGHPLEAITPKKLRRMRLLAGAWVAMNPEYRGRLRLDVVGILWRPDGMPEVSHARGVG